MHYYSYRRGNIYLVDIYLVHTKYIKNVCGQRSNPFKLFHPAEMRQPVFHRLDCLWGVIPYLRTKKNTTYLWTYVAVDMPLVVGTTTTITRIVRGVCLASSVDPLMNTIRCCCCCCCCCWCCCCCRCCCCWCCLFWTPKRTYVFLNVKLRRCMCLIPTTTFGMGRLYKKGRARWALSASSHFVNLIPEGGNVPNTCI